MNRPLVSAAELASHLDDEDLVLLDVRWRLLGPRGIDDYLSGHLPGAGFVDLETELAGPPGSHGRHPLPSAPLFQLSLRGHGVDADSQVVCYDQNDGTSAARLWWLLRYFGHRRVAVLDGGYDAWVSGGGPVDQQLPPAHRNGDWVAVPGGMPLLDADGAGRLASAGVLLDARTEERYAGRREPVDPVAGHIPSAVSAPTAANVHPDGRFRDAAELRTHFERLGVADGVAVGAYCGSGVTAAQEVLALELAGFSAALYADSWSGWITDPNRPVATG